MYFTKGTPTKEQEQAVQEVERAIRKCRRLNMSCVISQDLSRLRFYGYNAEYEEIEMQADLRPEPLF